MMTPMIELPGSEMVQLQGAHVVPEIDRDAPFTIALVLKPKEPIPEPTPFGKSTLGELADRHGPSDAAVTAVKSFALAQGLTVVDGSPDNRTILLSGTRSQMSAAFGVTLKKYQADAVTYRGYDGPVRIPEDLGQDLVGVLGLDTVPVMRPETALRNAASSSEEGGTYPPSRLATAYEFPDATGRGQCVGIVALGATFSATDVNVFFDGRSPETLEKTVGDLPNPLPTSFEPTCDVEVLGSLAPEARLVVYVGANTFLGWLLSIRAAVFDKTNRPSVLSMSWSCPESLWPTTTMNSFKDAFKAAAHLGTTVVGAAGDDAGAVDYPGSDPAVLCCGGTSLTLRANGRIASESAWRNTNGGESVRVPAPPWQHGKDTVGPGATTPTGRRVPDVAASADRQYQCILAGAPYLFGGTSAAAPVWAGLIARVNERLGRRIGFITPEIYARPKAFCRDIVKGTVNHYPAVPGWDRATGWGSPNGACMLDALHALERRVIGRRGAAGY